jgi:predicted naringenin-chalcone synthase
LIKRKLLIAENGLTNFAQMLDAAPIRRYHKNYYGAFVHDPGGINIVAGIDRSLNALSEGTASLEWHSWQ